MSDKVEIVDSIEELNSATYSNDKPNDPTLSVEKTDYVIGEDVDNIADVQAEQGKKNLKKSTRTYEKHKRLQHNLDKTILMI